MTNLPFFNWSIKRIIDLEPDPIDKARMRLVLQSLLLGICYCIIIIPFQLSQQPQQVIRTTVVCFIIIFEFKYLLWRPVWREVSHITLIVLTMVIWSNIYYYFHGIDILTMQFVMIVVLASFYILGSVWGISYSVVNILPLIIYVVFHGRASVHLMAQTSEVSSIPFSIALCFNMILIVFIHYHFFQVFSLYIVELNSKTGELKNIISDLESSKKELQNNNRFQKTIIAAIAHDIKGPLKYLTMLSKNLVNQHENRLQEVPENVKTELRLVRDSSVKIYNETDNLVQYAKFHLNDNSVKKELFNVYDLVNDRSIILVDLAKAQHNTISNSLSVKTAINTSRELLSIIIHNILDNAIKFTENDTIVFSSSFKGPLFYLTLKDNGRGMPEKLVIWCNENSSDIAKATQVGDINDQGLGLIIVKELLQKISGKLEVESGAEKGTAISIVIPSGLW